MGSVFTHQRHRVFIECGALAVQSGTGVLRAFWHVLVPQIASMDCGPATKDFGIRVDKKLCAEHMFNLNGLAIFMDSASPPSDAVKAHRLPAYSLNKQGTNTSFPR
jgi:hypothetical protein